jgi:hypothetical protein
MADAVSYYLDDKPYMGEWEMETMRYGAPDPVSKLGYDRNLAHVVDTGIALEPANPNRGWATRGEWSRNVEPETTSLERVVENLGYKSTEEFWDKFKNQMREGLTYDDWIAQAKATGDAREFVSVNAQAINPMTPALWGHEFGHSGQEKLKTPDSIREALADMRDAMYANPNRPRELETIALSLEDYSQDQLDNIHKLALHEIELANKMLIEQGRTPGAEPNMQPYKDWISGGRTEDGYKKVRREKRMYEEMTGYPNQIGVEQMKMPGFFDSMTNKIKGWFD